MKEALEAIEKRRAELWKELEALERAKEALVALDQEGVALVERAQVAVSSKPFMSTEARKKISEAQKAIWARRKAAHQVERGAERRKTA